MQNQRDEIADHESDGVSLRFEIRVSLPVDNNDAGEAEVDSCGKEGRADGQSDYVSQEAGISERVVVYEDAANITGHLQEQANDHSCHESPCSAVDAKSEIYDKNEGEKAGKEGVTGDGREVAHRS